MKKYLVFYGDNYYPSGGWSDYQGDFDTMEEAKTFLIRKSFDWYQIVNRDIGTVVES